MDLETQRAVLDRVYGREPAAPRALVPAQLENLVQAQQAVGVGLRALAGDLRGRERQLALRLAARCDSRVRKLETLYYLQTGRRLQLRPPAPAPGQETAGQLRTLCLALEEAGREARRLAGQMEDARGRLEQLGAECARHADLLQTLLRDVLARCSHRGGGIRTRP